MTTKEKIEVMQAFEDGETIQMAEIGSDNWIVHSTVVPGQEPIWNWEKFKYRVKLKSRFKEGDLVVCWNNGDVACRGIRVWCEKHDKPYRYDGNGIYSDYARYELYTGQDFDLKVKGG